MTQTAIVGWGHLPFGRIQEDVEQMLVGAAGAALDDAGLGPEDVDAIFLGWFNAGMAEQDFGLTGESGNKFINFADYNAHSIGIILLWIAAFLTLYTGYDYVKKGIDHAIE